MYMFDVYFKDKSFYGLSFSFEESVKCYNLSKTM